MMDGWYREYQANKVLSIRQHVTIFNFQYPSDNDTQAIIIKSSYSYFAAENGAAQICRM